MFIYCDRTCGCVPSFQSKSYTIPVRAQSNQIDSDLVYTRLPCRTAVRIETLMLKDLMNSAPIIREPESCVSVNHQVIYVAVSHATKVNGNTVNKSARGSIFISRMII